VSTGFCKKNSLTFPWLFQSHSTFFPDFSTRRGVTGSRAGPRGDYYILRASRFSEKFPWLFPDQHSYISNSTKEALLIAKIIGHHPINMIGRLFLSKLEGGYWQTESKFQVFSRCFSPFSRFFMDNFPGFSRFSRFCYNPFSRWIPGFFQALFLHNTLKSCF